MLNEFAESTGNPTSKKIIIVVGIVNLFVMIGLIIYSFYAWSTQHGFLSLGFLIYLVSLTAVQKVLDDGLRTKDIMSAGKKEVGTSIMGDAIISKLK